MYLQVEQSALWRVSWGSHHLRTSVPLLLAYLWRLVVRKYSHLMLHAEIVIIYLGRLVTGDKRSRSGVKTLVHLPFRASLLKSIQWSLPQGGMTLSIGRQLSVALLFLLHKSSLVRPIS